MQLSVISKKRIGIVSPLFPVKFKKFNSVSLGNLGGSIHFWWWGLGTSYQVIGVKSLVGVTGYGNVKLITTFIVL